MKSFSQFQMDKCPWRPAGHPEPNQRVAQIPKEISRNGLTHGENEFKSVTDDENTGYAKQIAKD